MPIMPSPLRMYSQLKFQVISTLAALAFAATSPAALANPQGAVYTMSNASAGNAVIVFARAADGSLTPAGTHPTGGAGSGGGLGNQGALVLDRNDHFLFAVNAGSNELTVFAIDPSGLAFADKIGTGGTTPISVSVHRD